VVVGLLLLCGLCSRLKQPFFEQGGVLQYLPKHNPQDNQWYKVSSKCDDQLTMCQKQKQKTIDTKLSLAISPTDHKSFREAHD
jgi:hypothetical protein